MLDCTYLYSLKYNVYLFLKIDNPCLGLEWAGKHLKFGWFSLEFIIQPRFRSGQTSHTPDGFGAPESTSLSS